MCCNELMLNKGPFGSGVTAQALSTHVYRSLTFLGCVGAMDVVRFAYFLDINLGNVSDRRILNTCKFG